MNGKAGRWIHESPLDVKGRSLNTVDYAGTRIARAKSNRGEERSESDRDHRRVSLNRCTGVPGRFIVNASRTSFAVTPRMQVIAAHPLERKHGAHETAWVATDAFAEKGRQCSVSLMPVMIDTQRVPSAAAM
jgi:hypothetical protein